MPRFSVDFDARAEAEARAAFLWYFDRNPRAAEGSQREFEAAVASPHDAPLSCAEIEPGIRRRLFNRYPYALLFRVVEDRVQIAAVMHLKREPGYWKQG